MQHFLLNSVKDRHKHAYLSWHNVTRPKQEGGLGLKNSESMNQAFLMKHLWRLFVGDNSLWVSVYKSKYFPHSDVLQASCKPTSSWAWKGISKQIPLFWKAIKWTIGTGDKLFLRMCGFLTYL